MPINETRQLVGYALVTAAIYAVVLTAATTAGGDGLPATQAHPETIEPSGVGAAKPEVRMSEPGALKHVHELRVRKCQAVVRALYPDSGFLPHCEFFISEHERQGIIGEWQWSLAYGGANFGLRVGATAPGNCAGPMDVKHWPLVLDPEANIAWHCREMAYYHKRGRRGYRLVKTVFLPSNPRDWTMRIDGNRYPNQIKRAYRRHVDAIHEAYQRGDLP